MKTNAQLLDEVIAVMADTWLSACDRRVIVGALVPTKFMVIDQQGSRLFGPASVDECRVFIHRSAALDVLRVLAPDGFELRPRGNLPVALNG